MMQKHIVKVVPLEEYGVVLEFDGSQSRVISKIDISYNSISTIIDSKKIVTLDRGNEERRYGEPADIIVHSLDGELLETFSVPYTEAINSKHNVVYLGGGIESGEMCGYIDFDKSDRTLHYIKLPIEFSIEGKAIDDILIRDNQMFLVDNIVFPKYLFEYSIEMELKPKVVDVIELYGATYEHVIKGDINSRWMVVLSRAVGDWGEGSFVTIYEGKIKKNTLDYTQPPPNSQKRTSRKPYAHFIDLTIMGNRLFLLTEKGLSCVVLTTESISLQDLIFFKPIIENAEKLFRLDDQHLIVASRNTYEVINIDELVEEKFVSNGWMTKLKDWAYENNISEDIIPEEDQQIASIEKFFDSERIDKISSLKDLSKAVISVASLPKEIKYLKNLKALSIATEKTPKEIGELKELKFLHLSTKSIPEEIVKLKNLQYLSLVYRGTEFPNSIFKLTKLEILDLRWNGLRELPEEISELKNLKVIKLSRNNLTELPVGFSKLQNLIELDLSRNNFKMFPTSLEELNHLKVLHLNNNEISKIPQSISKLQNLTWFDISNNLLTGLPMELGELENLHWFNAKNNSLIENENLEELKSILRSKSCHFII
jgi:hypothetical protein